MRAFVIAALMTALVAGLGFAFAPAPRGSDAKSRRIASARGEPSREGGAEAAGVSGDTRAGVAPAAGKHVFYQWTDERGSVRFARSIEEVPEAWRERAGQVEVDASAFQPKTAARRPARRPYADFAAADAPTRYHDVTIYTAPWCGWCRKTIAFLDERGVEYVNKDIDADPSNKDELIEKSGGSSIPVVEIDGSLIRGYSPNEMAALLE